MHLDLLFNKTISEFIKDVAKTDLSSSVPLHPWEQLHRKDYNKAVMLSKLTGSAVDIHLAFTPENQEQILRCMADGLPGVSAARIAKVEPKILKIWLKLGERGISPYREFALEYYKAEHLSVAMDNQTLTNSGFRGAEFRLRARHGWDQEKQQTTPTNVMINETNILQTPMSEMNGRAREAALSELIKAKAEGRIIDHD